MTVGVSPARSSSRPDAMTGGKSVWSKSRVLTNLKSVLVDEDGATLVEYALVVSLIAIACIATVTALGAQINTAFTTIKTKLAAA